MTMVSGQRYICQNPGCRCEIEVIKTSTEAESDPQCCCGAQMKKAYTKPVVKVSDKRPDWFADLPDTRK